MWQAWALGSVRQQEASRLGLVQQLGVWAKQRGMPGASWAGHGAKVGQLIKCVNT